MPNRPAVPTRTRVSPVFESLERRQLLAADIVATEVTGKLPDDLRASLTNSSRGFAAIRDMLREIGLGDDEPPFVESADLARLAGRYRGQESVVELTPEDGVLRVERTEIDPFSQEATVLPTAEVVDPGTRRGIGHNACEPTQRTRSG